MSTRERSESSVPSCPSCGAESEQVRPVVRQGQVPAGYIFPGSGSDPETLAGIIDVAYGCKSCGAEWGWEVLTDAYLAEHPEALSGARDASR